MALLETVNQMKQQGYADPQIIQYLQEQGSSPKDINDALAQSQVKAAIAPEMQAPQGGSAVPTPDQSYPQEQYAQQPANQGYGQETYYQQAMDIETVRDISRQIVDEAMQKTNQDLKGLNKLKTEIKFQLQNLDNRLTKIESIINQLQSDILRKVGEYGEGISNLSQEMRATQESFSKMVDPILDKKRPTSKKSTKKSSKEPSDSFENYLR